MVVTIYYIIHGGEYSTSRFYFLGMILLPILSDDTMAIRSALDRCIQTTLIVTPALLFVDWGLGLDDMNLLFDGFQVSALFVSISPAQQSIEDGKSHSCEVVLL